MDHRMPAFSLAAPPEAPATLDSRADRPLSRNERDRLLALTPEGLEVLRLRGVDLATFGRAPVDEAAQAARDRILAASWAGQEVLRRRRAQARVQGRPGAGGPYQP
jgi:hypothetical protein